MSILPDEVTNTPEERDHQKNGADSGENHCIDEHGCLLLCLSVWDGFTLSAPAPAPLIWINARHPLARRLPGKLIQVNETTPTQRASAPCRGPAPRSSTSLLALAQKLIECLINNFPGPSSHAPPTHSRSSQR
uniref:Uncharacterized protein n=1 Tax=Ectopseudomonas oleovorans TaxID=301 RepID=A0A653B9N9_ECTOL